MALTVEQINRPVALKRIGRTRRTCDPIPTDVGWIQAIDLAEAAFCRTGLVHQGGVVSIARFDCP